MLLLESNIDDKNLEGKQIISIANGLSSFVPYCNEMGNNTRCFGVDPVYGYLGHDYDEFLQNLSHLNAKPHHVLKPEDYDRFCTEENKQALIAGTGEKLPLSNNSVDLVVIGYLLGYLDDPELGRRIIDEALRVIEQDGEVRIPDIHFARENDRLSLVFEDHYMNENGERYIDMLEGLQDNNISVRTTRNLKPVGYQPQPVQEAIQRKEDVVTYNGLILRKDQQLPKITMILPMSYAQNVIANPPDDLMLTIDPSSLTRYRDISATPVTQPSVNVLGIDPQTRQMQTFEIDWSKKQQAYKAPGAIN